VLRLPTICFPEHRIVQVGLEHGRLQVVDDDPSRRTTEPFERVAVAGQPGADLLVEDQLGVLMAAIAERHHEHPRASGAAADRIEQRASTDEIHLRLLARRGVHADDGVGSGRLERAHEAADG
jgi:hypothetical protein